MPHPEPVHNESTDAALPDHVPAIAPGHEDAAREQARALLLAWYALSGRDLPWRQTRDPYAILVSEVMLQQTQVERVLPKYQEFLRLFPTLAALAEAPAADVIRAWSPLGYNVRAVRLREIARQAVACYGGALPATMQELLALKGIGRYTAGAIACFAFGQPVATVDTNIRRVLWRVFRGIEPPVWPAGQAAARAQLALAEWALPREHAYDWQQALMDLGATICVSRQPLCEWCPVTSVCAAYHEMARGTLFPSGAALARLRDARAAPASEESRAPARRVAESGAPYAPDAPDAPDAPAGAPGPAAITRRRPPRGGQANLPFTRTTRYFRGRVLAALRDAAVGAALELAELGPLIKPDWTPDDRDWLWGIVRGLARDGLVRVLPLARANADEPARDEPGATRVALP